jgi:hypothetical protein
MAASALRGIFADAFGDGIDLPAERVANIMIEAPVLVT